MSKIAGRLVALISEGRRDISKQQKSVDAINSRGTSVSPLNCYDSYIAISRRRDKGLALDATVARTGSVEARKIFAWRATKKGGSLEGVVGLLEAYRDPARAADASNLLMMLDREWALRLARLMAIQSIEPDDQMNAFTIYNFFVSHQGIRSLDTDNAKVFFDLCIKFKEFEAAKQVCERGNMNDPEKFYAETDLMNPFLSPFGNEEKWLCSLNKIFSKHSVEEIALQNCDERFANFAFFDKLTAKTVSSRSDGPLVTVVISVWNPDHALVTSVSSILSQSWKNIEVLLIEDNCSQEYAEILNFCASLDGRVRILRQAKNQGTYMARNLALCEARGEFITFQDADDWSHPRRIEKQVEVLLSEPDVVATSSRTVRATENLLFSYVGYPIPERLNTSSLMFRLQTVRDEIGFYDTVRKGADSEYLKRIEVAFGKQAYRALPSVLAIVRLSSESLSRSDFRAGWHHPAREAYRAAYSYWHKRIKAGDCSPYRTAAMEDRTFPAPLPFLVERYDPQRLGRRHYDVIVLGDWRQSGGPQNSMIEEIRALKERGYTVAIAHMEAFRFMTSKMDLLSEKIQSLVNAGVVDRVLLTDEVETTLLLIRYPPILQFPPAGRAKINARSAMLVVNQAPHEMDGSDLRYEVHDCIRNAKSLFDVHPIWVPQGPLVREIIAPLVPQNLLAESDLPGIITLDEWETSRRGLSDDRPVIGRYSRDDIMKFPATADLLLQCYPATRDIHVRIMGGTKTCRRILNSDAFPENWEMLDHGQLPAREFLDSIDFFVHFDHESIVEAFGRSILEAMASGRVVILPPKFEVVFGEGAIYCTPDHVYGTVMKFWEDREAYANQSEVAKRLVRERFGREAFINTIKKLAPELQTSLSEASGTTSASTEETDTTTGEDLMRRQLVVAERDKEWVQSQLNRVQEENRALRAEMESLRARAATARVVNGQVPAIEVFSRRRHLAEAKSLSDLAAEIRILERQRAAKKLQGRA